MGIVYGFCNPVHSLPAHPPRCLSLLLYQTRACKGLMLKYICVLVKLRGAIGCDLRAFGAVRRC